MNKNCFCEFFYYNQSLPDAPYDFTDSNVLSAEKRKEFLTRYALFSEKVNGISDTPEQVVTEEEAVAMKELLLPNPPAAEITRRISFERMEAFLHKKEEQYENWTMYTGKVSVSNMCVCFRDSPVPPSPAAAYYFSGILNSFSFSFRADGSYGYPITYGVLDTTYGRTVELRSGIDDIIKLQFYSNGMLYARLGNECPYHLKNVPIGQYRFDEWQTVTVIIENDGFFVELNGVKSEKLPLSVKLNPDMLFIGCGMFHNGEWIVRPEKMVLESGIITNFFKKPPEKKSPFIPLGTVSLPFAVGTYKNRDCELIFRKEFEITELFRAKLRVFSLDPGGSIWINKKCVAVTDSFEELELDVENYLHIGKNELCLKVNPRAPEVHFNWHRQKDAYNGWFCEGADLTLYSSVKPEHIRIITKSISESRISFNALADINGAEKAEIFLKEIFPDEREEVSLGKFRAENGKLCAEVTADAKVWSPENPVLYSVRIQAFADDDTPLCDETAETGFRIIEQRDGGIYLNGSKIILKGALLMQFLPPHSETPVTHICPSTEQIIRQFLMLKRMNGNTLRLHILGYGTNDARFARIADRLGIMLIWTTRYIDSVEQIPAAGKWFAGDGYIRQISLRLNNPSIIMWEGSNEYHPNLSEIDRIYSSFVPAVKSVDKTRIICPVSHLYYAGDLYPMNGCGYYNDDGTADNNGNKQKAPAEWKDPLVIRSAHTYSLLLGYGSGWEHLRNQDWKLQPELCKSRSHAYIISEFAIIGRQNPNVPQAAEYYNPYSYELSDDSSLGFKTTVDEWRESQAYQALSAAYCVNRMRDMGVDGMLWCCLMGGANDGGYLKPPIDNYGYPKLAFYALQNGFAELSASLGSFDIIKGRNFSVNPVIYGTNEGKRYELTIRIFDSQQHLCYEKTLTADGAQGSTRFGILTPQLNVSGYYSSELKIRIVE